MTGCKTKANTAKIRNLRHKETLSTQYKKTNRICNNEVAEVFLSVMLAVIKMNQSSPM